MNDNSAGDTSHGSGKAPAVLYPEVLDIDEQISRLASKGVDVSDYDSARKLLSGAGYARIMRYVRVMSRLDNKVPSVPRLLAIGILVLKEVSIGIMTLLTLHHTGMVYGAGWYGKLCTAVIYLSMFVLMLWRTAPDWFLYADAALCACLILLAFVKYAIRYGGILREARADGARKQA